MCGFGEGAVKWRLGERVHVGKVLWLICECCVVVNCGSESEREYIINEKTKERGKHVVVKSFRIHNDWDYLKYTIPPYFLFRFRIQVHQIRNRYILTMWYKSTISPSTYMFNLQLTILFGQLTRFFDISCSPIHKM